MSFPYRFNIELNCPNCIDPTQNVLSNLSGYEVFLTKLQGLTYQVTFIVEEDEAANDARKQELKQYLTDLSLTFEEETFFSRFFLRSHGLLGGLGVGFGFILLLGMLLSGAWPMAAMIALGVIGTGLILILGLFSLRESYIDLRYKHHLSMDVLFVISGVVVLILSIGSFFVPWLPMMFDAGLLIFGFRHLGLAIKQSLDEKITEYTSFLKRSPKTVKVIQTDESLCEKLLSEVQLDEILLVSAEEIIPLDGICCNEGKLFTEIKTGNSYASESVKSGNSVFAGMKVASNSPPLKIKVSKLEADSFLASLDKDQLKQAATRAPIEEQTQKWLNWFVPIVLGTAFISGLVLACFFPPVLAIQCAAAVLVSACPCILGMVVPMALRIGKQKALSQGASLQEPERFLNAAKVDAAVFDLRGTLTKGLPKVIRVVTLNTKEDWLTYAGLIEQGTQHRVGKAVYDYVCATRKLPEQIKLISKTVLYTGLIAEFEADRFLIGNDKLMSTHSIQLPESPHLNSNETLIYFAKNNEVLGYFLVSDSLREDAHLTIQKLDAMGIASFICTGEHQSTARRYAQAIGIPPENVVAGRVPIFDKEGDLTKSDFIKQLEQQGYTPCFVGDGPNDANAMAACGFSIAVKSTSGDEITQQGASAVIESKYLQTIPTLFAIAKQTATHINQNLILSFSYNFVAMLLASVLLVAFGCVLNPGIGAGLMIAQMGFVFANAYRFNQQQVPFKTETVSLQKNETSSYHKVLKPLNVQTMLRDLFQSNRSLAQKSKIVQARESDGSRKQVAGCREELGNLSPLVSESPTP